MDDQRAAIAALLFILLIVGINFVMYGIARGAAKGGNSRWITALRDSLSKPLAGRDKSMEELRKRVEELKDHKNDG